MDIRDIRSGNAGAADEARSTRGVGPSSAARPASDRSDRVTLSDRAQAFQETRRTALEVPDVRSDRVNAVRAKLADGSLAADPERIARALLAQGIVSF